VPAFTSSECQGRLRHPRLGAVYRPQRLRDPFEVGAGIVQAGGGHGERVRPHRRLDLHLSDDALELQALVADQRLLGNPNLDLAQRAGLACEPAPRRQVEGGEEVPVPLGRRRNLAAQHDHAAAPARSLAPAQGGDADPTRLGRIEERGPARHGGAPADRLEVDDAAGGLGGAHDCLPRAGSRV
jgi:hypothetical protein